MLSHGRLWAAEQFCRLGWLAVVLLAAGLGMARGQEELPDAPAPQMELLAAGMNAAGGGGGEGQTFPPAARQRPGLAVPGLEPTYMPVPQHCRVNSCSEAAPQATCCQPTGRRFSDYLKQNAEHLYTPKELGLLAIHGVTDPFNLLTIGWSSALSVATDSHSPYGPGMPGFARQSGVALTQDMTGEFFGTFLIPSIDHQDPHYHRRPNISIPRRLAHAIYQPFWTQSDTGQGMVNYSIVVGVPVEEGIGTAYVPYQQMGWGASAERIAVDWATSPIGNLITEFVPDVARRINVRVVLVQRIINQVALEEGGGAGAAP